MVCWTLMCEIDFTVVLHSFPLSCAHFSSSCMYCQDLSLPPWLCEVFVLPSCVFCFVRHISGKLLSPRAYLSCPHCSPSPSFLLPLFPIKTFIPMSLSHPFNLFPCHSVFASVLTTHKTSLASSIVLSYPTYTLLSLLCFDLSGLRTAPAPQGRQSWQASKSWMTSARK